MGDDAPTPQLRDAQEALCKIASLIASTPMDKFKSAFEAAALKIQAVQRGKQARKEVQINAPAGSSTLTSKAASNAAKLSAMFGAIDTSGDGLVDVNEFVEGLK